MPKVRRAELVQAVGTAKAAKASPAHQAMRTVCGAHCTIRPDRMPHCTRKARGEAIHALYERRPPSASTYCRTIASHAPSSHRPRIVGRPVGDAFVGTAAATRALSQLASDGRCRAFVRWRRPTSAALLAGLRLQPPHCRLEPARRACDRRARQDRVRLVFDVRRARGVWGSRLGLTF